MSSEFEQRGDTFAQAVSEMLHLGRGTESVEEFEQLVAEAKRILDVQVVAERDWFQRNRMPTFEALAEIEPRLAELKQEAASVVDDGGKSFCANRVWYSRFKPRLNSLVGFDRDTGPAVIRSCNAWDLAIRVIYRELPDCRNCSCY
jgi:hypothetical protein